MAVSIALSGVLKETFTYNHRRYGRIRGRNSIINYEDNNVYNASLKIQMNKSNLIIPVTGRCTLDSTLFTSFQLMHRNILNFSDIVNREYYFPLIRTERSQNKRTSNSVFRTLLSENGESRLTHVITGKGDEYYGAPGIVLDKDYNILLMFAFKASISHLGIQYQDLIMYVNPSIFLNKDIVSKNIISNIIPYFIENKVAVDGVGTYDYVHYSTNLVIGNRFNSNPRVQVSIEIKDVTPIFISLPEKPTVQTIDKTLINNFLIEELPTINNLLT